MNLDIPVNASQWNEFSFSFCPKCIVNDKTAILYRDMIWPHPVQLMIYMFDVNPGCECGVFTGIHIVL